MKSRTQFFIVVGLLILVFGITLLAFLRREQEPVQALPATIQRDCAPWDGAAFAVKIPVRNGTVINISIYQSPEIAFPATFSFPDETGRTGSAFLLSSVGEPEELRGRVSFPRVEQGMLTEGKFDLHTETGEPFKGNFKAEWGNEVVLCG